jgi:hypothetical protein
MPAQVDDRVWRKLYNTVRKADGASVKVGLFDGELAEIGMIHEFGAPKAHIPARPFIKQTFVNHRGDLVALQRKLAAAIMTGRIDEKRAMGLLGAWAAGAIKATITRDGNFAPLAPSTIAAKSSSKPLVETGQMANAITFVVVA